MFKEGFPPRDGKSIQNRLQYENISNMKINKNNKSNDNNYNNTNNNKNHSVNDDYYHHCHYNQKYYFHY